MSAQQGQQQVKRLHWGRPTSRDSSSSHCSNRLSVPSAQQAYCAHALSCGTLDAQQGQTHASEEQCRDQQQVQLQQQAPQEQQEGTEKVVCNCAWIADSCTRLLPAPATRNPSPHAPAIGHAKSQQGLHDPQ